MASPERRDNFSAVCTEGSLSNKPTLAKPGQAKKLIIKNFKSESLSELPPIIRHPSSPSAIRHLPSAFAVNITYKRHSTHRPFSHVFYFRAFERRYGLQTILIFASRLLHNSIFVQLTFTQRQSLILDSFYFRN